MLSYKTATTFMVAESNFFPAPVRSVANFNVKFCFCHSL